MKHLIEKLIQRLLGKCRKNQLRYLFARLLAEIVKDKDKTNDVLISIASYFIKYHGGEKFQFNDIFVVGNIIYIYTFRPGYWIGKGGSESDRLLVECNYNAKMEKVADYQLRFIELLNDATAGITTYIHINAQHKVFRVKQLLVALARESGCYFFVPKFL